MAQKRPRDVFQQGASNSDIFAPAPKRGVGAIGKPWYALPHKPHPYDIDTLKLLGYTPDEDWEDAEIYDDWELSKDLALSHLEHADEIGADARKKPLGSMAEDFAASSRSELSGPNAVNYLLNAGRMRSALASQSTFPPSMLAEAAMFAARQLRGDERVSAATGRDAAVAALTASLGRAGIGGGGGAAGAGVNPDGAAGGAGAS